MALRVRAPQAGEQVVDAQGRVTTEFAALMQQLARALSAEQDTGVDLTAEVDALATDVASINSSISALEALPSFASGATWSDVSASRAAATTYQNTSGNLMQVGVGATASEVCTFEVSSDESTWITVGQTPAGSVDGVHFIVPVDWYYRLNGTVTGITFWAELS